MWLQVHSSQLMALGRCYDKLRISFRLYVGAGAFFTGGQIRNISECCCITSYPEDIKCRNAMLKDSRGEMELHSVAF